ncbi:MAG: ATPase, T2SS/T4P/T4SS family [Elusimicrobia bacterium]|nr:ATPase, T2SS/T4P/T4SS family [Elusimicrobiota bacterium]
MGTKHIFKDEWLLEVVLKLPNITADVIEDLRNKRCAFLSESLVDSQKITIEMLERELFETHQIPYFNPDKIVVEKLALSFVPEKICRRHGLIPFRLRDEIIDVLMINPLDFIARNDVQVVTGRNPKPYYCIPSKIEALIAEQFNPEIMVYDLLGKMDEKNEVEVLQDFQVDKDYTSPEKIMPPVIKLVNSLIAKAVKMRASDIHIEHEDYGSIVRFRIDGFLKNIMTIPRKLATGPLVSRIKIMADLNLAEHFKPQDGRAKLLVNNIEIGLRVSTLPTSYGETVVLRLLNPKSARVPFEELGFKQDIANRLRDILNAEQGIILITGPTGSGKTTSLYSMLNMIKKENTNIITIEDPIEYRMEGVNQVQVNEKQGLTFATILRSVLRQDPDTILVGEIRDRETADITFQTAMTGHLVFSTLHTNDTVSSITRLIDMGVERFKISPAMLAITAQRLVRRLCPDCKEPATLTKTDSVFIEGMLKKNNLSTKCFKPVGCVKCDFSGYKGRLAILELLEVTREIKNLISAGEKEYNIHETAMKKGFLWPMNYDALWHLSQGDTSLDEIFPYLNIMTDIKPSKKEYSVSKIHEPAPVPSNKNKRVLIADDDTDVRNIIKIYLNKNGYDVDEASDGREVIDMIAQKIPDLLLLDLMMPRLDGFGVIQRIRSGLGLIKLPIIVLTALSDEESQENVINLGADDYIIKPFNPDLFIAKVNAAFRRVD